MGFVLARKFVFPNPNYPPALHSQSPVHQHVTLFIPGKLAPPERAIVLWLCGVPWAAMPETAVHKNCQLNCLKNEIRLGGSTQYSPWSAVMTLMST
jgi:hypothetical protein